MVRILKTDMPSEWEGAPPEACAEINPETKVYDDLHPRDMPAFYAQAGLLEGCFQRLATVVWFDGEITLVVTKGEYVLEGLVNLYGDEPCYIDDEPVFLAVELEKIKKEAQKLASNFEARRYRVGFKLTATFQLKEKGGEFTQH